MRVGARRYVMRVLRTVSWTVVVLLPIVGGLYWIRTAFVRSQIVENSTTSVGLSPSIARARGKLICLMDVTPKEIVVGGTRERFIIDSAWIERRYRISYRFFYLVKEVEFLNDYLLVFSLDNEKDEDSNLDFQLFGGRHCGIQSSGIGKPFVYNTDLGGPDVLDTVRVTAYYEKKPITELVFARADVADQ